MLKLCIFDLDGTLLDTLADLADSCNRVLTANHYPTHPIDCYRTFVGNGVLNLITRILPEEERSSARIEELKQQFDLDYKAHCLDKSCPYEGVSCLLNQLKEAGLLTAILSNKPDAFTQQMVTSLLPFHPFDSVSGQKPGGVKKPDPEAVFALLRHFSVEPSEAVLIGDSDVDILTAKNAGITSIGAEWGFRGAKELMEAGTDHLAKTPLDCLPLLLEQS